VGPVKKNI